MSLATQRQESIALSTWHRIERPTWQAGVSEIREGLPFAVLSPFWQMFLLGDGAPTRHLHLLTQTDITIDLVAMADIGDRDDDAPQAIAQIPAPRTRRQIWLRSDRTGEIFSHATSWWHTPTVGKYLNDPKVGIWTSLDRKHAELYRELLGAERGSCPILTKTFGFEGPYWGRYYLLWSGGQPISLIYEIYSPILTRYLGPSTI